MIEAGVHYLNRCVASVCVCHIDISWGTLAIFTTPQVEELKLIQGSVVYLVVGLLYHETDILRLGHLTLLQVVWDVKVRMELFGLVLQQINGSVRRQYLVVVCVHLKTMVNGRNIDRIVKAMIDSLNFIVVCFVGILSHEQPCCLLLQLFQFWIIPWLIGWRQRIDSGHIVVSDADVY